MSTNDILSQDEIDALIHGVDNGDLELDEEDVPEGTVQSYDFTSQDRIVRGRLPTLEMINGRFARQFRISLFNMLRRAPQIDVGDVQVLKFGEYVRNLFVPTSLNMVKVRPLRGTSLFNIDSKLVFSLVDNFFGGDGRFHAKIEGREFTATEMRVVQMMLNCAFVDLKKAWTPVTNLEFQYVSSEVNPQFANIVSPSEVVVVSSFHIELEGGGGDFHVTMPYSMLEPIRDLLGAGIQSDSSEMDERWSKALRYEMKRAEVSLDSSLARTRISLKDVLSLKKGDVIPIDIPELTTLRVEGLAIFLAEFGISNGMNALKIVKPVALLNHSSSY
ncbi:MAG: flagellar motor switch protein FliM [Gammaproteobacteria bacterium]|nr:flagellar motor switch protein FliM [Gammaproteobacteria bacterium]